MPLLRTDNEGKNVPSVWLGPPDLIRWPFDASYGQWVLGFALTIPTFTILGFIVPVIVWAGVFAWFFGKFVTQRFPDRTPKLLLNPWFWRGAVMLFVALALPNPLALILPVNIFAALALTPVVAFLIVRKIKRWITPMTPIRYWMRVLWKLLRRPRSAQAAKEFSPVANVAGDEELDFDLGDLELPREPVNLRKDMK